METLTAILVVITAIYVYLTHLIAKRNEMAVQEMRRQHEAAYRPYITVYPRIGRNSTYLYLTIANAGKSAANALRLSLDTDFPQFGNAHSNLRMLSAFAEEIGSLAPGSELRFHLGNDDQLFGGTTPMPLQFTVAASYSHDGKLYSESSSIDLRPFRGSAIEAREDPTVQIVEKLGQIARALERR